jgi:RNA polymerase sigma-70 factor (ECF subfamily)
MSPPHTAPPNTASSPEHARWFADHVHPHDSQLKAYLKSAYPSVRDVDDVVQESYLRIWRRQAARPIESVKSFLFQIARRLALDHLRHERVSPIAPVKDFSRMSVIDHKPGVRETTCLQEETALLFEAIDALPVRCREIFMLRKLRGLSQKEIAAQLGISEQTVEAQIFRGTRRCGDYLSERGVTPP